jgi:hypothetical protein
VVRSLGRLVLLHTASWWRKAKLSRASWRWPADEAGAESKQAEQESDHRAEIVVGRDPVGCSATGSLVPDGLITHAIGLDRVPDALRPMARGQAPKVLIDPRHLDHERQEIA